MKCFFKKSFNFKIALVATVAFLSIQSSYSIDQNHTQNQFVTEQDVIVAYEHATIKASQIVNATYSLALEVVQLSQQLSLLINNHQVQIKANRRELLDLLRDIQGITTDILNQQAAVTNLDDPQVQLTLANTVLEISNYFIKKINSLISSNFSKVSPLDLSTLFKRGIKENVSFDECEKNLTSLHKKIERVKLKANNAGLTWYNIRARQFEKHVLDPAIKYHIPELLKFGGLATAVIAIGLWIQSYPYMTSEISTKMLALPEDTNLTPDSIDLIYNDIYKELYDTDMFFKIMATLQHYFGVTNPKGSMGATDAIALRDPLYQLLKRKSEETAQRIPLRKLCVLMEGFVTSLGLGYIPPVAMVGSLFVVECKQLWLQELKGWFSQQKDSIWNALRGGAYAQKAVSGVWDMQPTIRFKDVVGLDEIKEQFSFILKFIENPEQYIRVNAAPPRGYFLTGPTRTGKTYIVEAFCGEIEAMLEKTGRQGEMKFWRINSQIIGEFGLQQILSFAKENAPIVLFIDEIDLHGLQRVTNNKMLEQFLTALGNTLDNDPRKQVILITATNKPETIDKALRQPDRLGREIRFEYPSLSYRTNFLKASLEKMGIDTKHFDLVSIAQKTAGKSFSDLSSMLNNTIMRSWIYGKQVSQELFEESIDSELRHIIFEDRKELPEYELRILATHLAGKALVSLHFKTRMLLDKVTVKAVMPDLQEELPFEELMKKNEKEQQQKIRHGELFRFMTNDTVQIGSYEQKINEINYLIAGSIAEEVIFGASSYEYRHDDLTKAYIYAQDIAFEGIDPRLVGKKEFNALSQNAYKLLSECKESVRTFLSAHRDQITKIADLLIKEKTVHAKTIEKILAEI